MNGELVDSLLARLRTASSKRALHGLLCAVNDEQNLPRGQLRVTGSKADLLQHIRSGFDNNLLPVARLVSLVDALEENGGQHIFLFDLTPEGLTALCAHSLRQAFAPMPPDPSPSMYSETPPHAHTYFAERPDGLLVKQVHTVTFWEQDEARSYSNDDERATVYVRRRKRAINLLKVQPDQRRAEIRISKVTASMDDKTAGEHFQEFCRTLSPTVNLDTHLQPTPIWNGFPTIVATRAGTFMSTDDAQDPSIRITMSNRRAGWRGHDIRDHPTYRFADANYVRKRLNIYWDTASLLPSGFEPEHEDLDRVHTILSKFVLNDRPYGKLYVAAVVSPEVLSGVTERVRRFARESP